MKMIISFLSGILFTILISNYLGMNIFNNYIKNIENQKKQQEKEIEEQKIKEYLEIIKKQEQKENSTFTINGKKIEYSLLDTLPEETIKEILSGEIESVFKQTILNEIEERNNKQNNKVKILPPDFRDL